MIIWLAVSCGHLINVVNGSVVMWSLIIVQLIICSTHYFVVWSLGFSFDHLVSCDHLTIFTCDHLIVWMVSNYLTILSCDQLIIDSHDHVWLVSISCDYYVSWSSSDHNHSRVNVIALWYLWMFSFVGVHRCVAMLRIVIESDHIWWVILTWMISDT